jgi:hypothetical protein
MSKNTTIRSEREVEKHTSVTGSLNGCLTDSRPTNSVYFYMGQPMF